MGDDRQRIVFEQDRSASIARQRRPGNHRQSAPIRRNEDGLDACGDLSTNLVPDEFPHLSGQFRRNRLGRVSWKASSQSPTASAIGRAAPSSMRRMFSDVTTNATYFNSVLGAIPSNPFCGRRSRTRRSRRLRCREADAFAGRSALPVATCSRTPQRGAAAGDRGSIRRCTMIEACEIDCRARLFYRV